ncbi:hypothetical protein DFJ58DRAFT_716828 [Suillus subalutaceus]|uniref:uncharacterized protein n=1 Tax=Suillus subalutaceus TaxID=48586 RepID=UPI001B874C6A|nr:uncharacterized protein DFJ58DRAFT_716828 [Suillus subalutaceus]KAG1850194.1 hypothetical protein DFJ58DRAFT_716828 [Suillus subalutaceus]
MPDSNDYSFSITTVNIFTLSTCATFHRLEDSLSPVQSLVSAGFLGNAPHNPSIAISLRTLEHYRLLRLCKPSLSIEAFAKVICDSYLTLDTALGRDAPNWRVLNACPPCSYELNGEPPLKFTPKRMMGIGDQQCGNTQVYDESDYMLPRTVIDRFTNEVLQSRSAHQVNDRPDDDTISEAEEDVSWAHIIAEDCSKNWKAAADDDKKRIHGFILWYADMIRSGELAKYPLAIVAKVLEIISECTLGAYDIGCGYSSTVRASSLGTTFMEMQSRLCVDSFHGYAHNYVCQTQHHPLGIEGAGLEDFGVAERIFSASNVLAPVIRYASAYRRHMFLDLFFKQWDEDKYANLGTILLNNYRQALQIISLETVALEEAKTSLGVQDTDLVNWRAEEIRYFQMLGKELEWDAHAIVYVELLQQMQELECQASANFNCFISAAPDDYQFTAASESNFYSANLSQTWKLKTQQHFAAECFSVIQCKVISMEIKLGIANHWNISSPEYQDTLKYMTLRKYHKALDNIQPHVSQTTIQNAVRKYNEAASDLQPPQPPLECFLDEFNLLCETRQDIREKPWTKPAVWETIRQYLRIQRAKEEITRFVVENEAFTRILDALKTSNSPIFVAVHEHCTHRRRINQQLLSRIAQIHCLDAFSGDKSSGIIKGSSSVEVPSAVTTDQPLENDESEEGLDESDEVERDIGTLIECISDMALRP